MSRRKAEAKEEVVCTLYSASWCAPCKLFKKQHWPSLKKDFSRIRFRIVDIEKEEPDIAIASIPVIHIRQGSRTALFRHVFDEIEEIKQVLRAPEDNLE